MAKNKSTAAKPKEYDTWIPLTDKQELFCVLYVKYNNATRAAIEAGYSQASAYQIGHENLSKLEISDRIAELTANSLKRTYISADKVLQELARIAFANPKDYYDENGEMIPIHELSDDAAAAIAGVQVTKLDKFGRVRLDPKLSDKKAALTDLGKHVGLYEKDNQQKSQTVIFNIDTEDEGLID